MFESDEEEEDFREMLRECYEHHQRIDEGMKQLLQSNPCHHFTPFGDYMIGRTIVIGEVIDEYRHMHLLAFGSHDLRPWEVQGMLDYVKSSVIQEHP